MSIFSVKVDFEMQGTTVLDFKTLMECKGGPSLEQATAKVTFGTMEKFKYRWF